jgi:hypothetical protein
MYIVVHPSLDASHDDRRGLKGTEGDGTWDSMLYTSGRGSPCDGTRDRPSSTIERMRGLDKRYVSKLVRYIYNVGAAGWEVVMDRYLRGVFL